MNEDQENNLFQAIGKVEGKIDGINQRLDIANGRTSKAEGKIELIEKQQARADGRLTAYGWIFGGGIAIIGVVLTALQLYFSLSHKS